MNLGEADPVSQALRDPSILAELTLSQWDELIPQARRSNLLARIATSLEERGMLERTPAAPRAHLQAARVVAAAQERAVRREVSAVCDALAATGERIALLKGAAYLLAGLPPARGRLFSDIDILVPQAKLAEVEAALMLHGWATTHHNPYDQRYYRRWMHELPPMRHNKRLTVLDVHHAILPPTARLRPDSAKLLAAAQSLADDPQLCVLAPADMVLHSASHLFHNEEFGNGLRDLADLDALLRHFGGTAGFWAGLVPRAIEMDLARPLFYGLRYTSRMLGTPVPEAIMRAAEAARPMALTDRLMDALFLRALQPERGRSPDRLAALARKALYVRAHWLRMPPGLLAYHLTRKALRREEREPH